MQTPQGTTAAAPPASKTSQKMLQLLCKRLRQLWRVTLGSAICFAMAAAAVAIWWLISLNRLPDIGDPFDVAAFRAFSVPDEHNAFTFLKRARERLTPVAGMTRRVRARALAVAWSKADPKVREWVEVNRPALELFQQGAEQLDGIAHRADEPLFNEDSTDLTWLALVEGGRRTESGNMSGAWSCYRAVLRMANHIRRRGSMAEGWIIGLSDGALRQMLETWAADPRTTVPQLRVALQDLLENEPKPEWYAFSLKLQYLDMMRDLERPFYGNAQQDLDEEFSYRLFDMQVPAELAGTIYAARRWLLREPERSRRVLKLLCANWLAHAENPGLPPRKPAVRAAFSLTTSTNGIAKTSNTVPLYHVDPAAPARAAAMPPQELASWLVTTNDVALLLYGYTFPTERHQAMRAHSALLITLASELYHRERGTHPRSEQALVGTYLKTLPDDGSAEFDDGTATTVR